MIGMQVGFPLLLGQTRTIYQWLRVEQLDQWWHWLLLVTISVAVLLYVVFWYRRDSVEQHRAVGWALPILRIAALVGLLVYFMQLDKRTEQRIVRQSRVAVLADTSMSMSLPGTPSSAGIASTMTRAEEATRLIGDSTFLQELSKEHQLAVYRFDRLSRPISLAAIDKTSSLSDALPDDRVRSAGDPLASGRWLMLVAVVVGGLASIMLAISLSAQIVGAKNWHPGSWLLLMGSVLALVSLLITALAVMPATEYPIVALLGVDAPPLATSEAVSADSQAEALVTLPDDWGEALSPRGSETRLGDAIKSILDREAGSPLAGIIVLTDGRNNAGVGPKEVLVAAKNARVPLYVIGLGSATSPPNVELVETDVPKRLYPGDRFSLSALIGSTGFAGKTVTVQVLSGPVGAPIAELSIEDEDEVILPAEGSLATAVFQLEPKSVGTWQYVVQVVPLSGDIDTADNRKAAEVEVIERKNRVLIVAGGPTREYQFVRNLLYRDRDVESHVLLQTGTEATSQESQELLREFPSDRKALADYDAVLAFDVDWTAIPDRSVEALEQWVAEQAGGFLLVTGSVETPKWLSRSASGTSSQFLRSLSPVVLEQRGSALLAPGRVEAETAWPLTLTADGVRAEFLWLTDDPETSREMWQDFEGVHSYYAAYELKPGAKSLLHFSDPTAAMDGQPPIYMASQFYGAGRCVFLGGSELWRLRRLGDQYFDRFYTKLLRWISQGRLLLDSDRGVLLVDREQALLGDQVVLRAVLKNERYEPLLQSEVVVRLIDPQKRNSPVVLRPLADGSQPGVYTGQFPVLLAGDYTAQFHLGGLASDEVLSTSVKAKMPALEMQRAERSDKLLSELARETGGKYWTGVESASTPSENGVADIINSIPSQDQVAYLPGAPDKDFQLRWLGWLMAWIAGSLSLEWLSRRLHRLA